MFFTKNEKPNTLKTVLAIVGGVVDLAGIAAAITAIVKSINKKLAAKAEEDCFCECCGECCCEDAFCGEECTVEDPVTVVAEGREVTDETVGGESI